LLPKPQNPFKLCVRFNKIIDKSFTTNVNILHQSIKFCVYSLLQTVYTLTNFILTFLYFIMTLFDCLKTFFPIYFDLISFDLALFPFHFNFWPFYVSSLPLYYGLLLSRPNSFSFHYDYPSFIFKFRLVCPGFLQLFYDLL